MVINHLANTTDVADLGGAFSPERLSYAGEMTLLGMLMVFSVLAILWVVLSLFKVLFAKNTDTPKTHKADDEAVQVTAPAANVEQPVSSTNDDQLVAILTAAVAAYISSEEPSAAYSGGFRVVSFRRADGKRSWNSK